MGQRDSRIRMLQDVILPRVDSSTFPDSVRHVQTVLVKYKYPLPSLPVPVLGEQVPLDALHEVLEPGGHARLFSRRLPLYDL